MALDVVLLKQPFEVSFSGNPMPYSFAITPYGDVEKSQDIRLIVKVYLEQSFGSSAFTELKSQVFSPNNAGMVQFDVSSIIDPYLEYYRPKPTLTRPVQAFGQRKRYKVSYVLQQNNVVIGAVQDSATGYALKGGLAYDQWHPSDFFAIVTSQQCRPLQFAAEGEKMGLEETRYLFWTYPYADNVGQTIIFTITNNVGDVVEVRLPQTIYCGKWGVCCVPVGYTQMNLGIWLAPDTYPVSYTVKVMADTVEVVAPYQFTIDYRNFYKTYQLLYRNSAGGLETIRLRGQVDFQAEYDQQQAQRSMPPSYFTGSLLQAQLEQHTLESPKYQGDTGFLPEEAIQKLRDFFLSKQRYELENGKLIPIIANAKSVKFYSNKDNLLSLQLDWQRAYVNEYFTPKALLPTMRLCPAVETLVVKQISKTKLQILYALPIPYDRMEVTIQIGNMPYTYQYTGNTGNVIQTFAPPTVITLITIKGRVVCDEIEGDYGPYTTVGLNLVLNSLPVAGNDTYSIAAGFNTAVQLNGSVLANDYDPDGDPIEVIAATGTTSQGGSYSVDAAGNVTYTPPSSAFRGADTFTYQVREVGGTDTVTATVTINVGTATTALYAKLVKRNTYNYSGPYNSSSGGEVWVDFFSDPAAQQPVDVTGMNLTVAVRQDTEYQSHDGNKTNNTETLSAPASGTKVQFYNGEWYNSSYDEMYPFDEYTQLTFTLLPGTGYTVI